MQWTISVPNSSLQLPSASLLLLSFHSVLSSSPPPPKALSAVSTAHTCMGHSPEHGNLSGPDSPQLISMREGLEHTCCCAAVWLDLVPGLMQAVPVLWVHDCSSHTKLLTLRLLYLFPPPFRLGDGGVKIDVPFRIEHSFLLLTAFWVIMHLTVDCPPLLRELSLAKAESSPVVGVGTGHT